MICRNCGDTGAIIQTVTADSGNYYWHQRCLSSWRVGFGFTLPPPLQRYLWGPEIVFDAIVYLPDGRWLEIKDGLVGEAVEETF